MDITKVRANRLYEYEKYSYIRYFKKRDISRHVTFDSYSDFIVECQKFTKDRIQNIEIQHEICVNGRLFKLSGKVPSTAILQLNNVDNLFDNSFTLDMYVDENEMAVDRYITKVLLTEFLDSE